MAPHFQPPAFVKPKDYSWIPQTIDALFEAYHKGELERQQRELTTTQLGVAKGQMASQQLNERGQLGGYTAAEVLPFASQALTAPGQVPVRPTPLAPPPAAAPASLYAPGAPATPFYQPPAGPEPMQAAAEDPRAGALREFFEKARAGKQIGLAGQVADVQKTQAETLKLRAEAGTPKGGIDDKTRASIEGGIMDDFMKSQSAKDFDQVKNAVRNISKLTSQKGGIADVGTLYSFVKMLDPNSVVREGEIALSQNAVPGLDKIALAWNRFKSGEINTDDMNRQIKTAAKDLYNERGKGYQEARGAYSARARQYGIDPNVAVPDLSIPHQEMETMFGVPVPQFTAPAAPAAAAGGLDQNPEAVKIREDFKAGRLTREAAKASLSRISNGPVR